MEQTETIYIKGLEQEGPGDIVGAIASKTSASGNHIGNIDMDNTITSVELAPEHVEEVTSVMNDNRIGHADVQVWAEQDESDQDRSSLEQYIDHWSELVELERQQEMEEHEREIRQLSGNEREAKGRAVLHLRGRDEGEGLSGYLVKFMRNRKGEPLPDTEITVGDLVMLSKKDPLRDDNPTGTVTQKTNYSFTVSFGEKPPGFVFGKHLRLDLYVNDITYQRMLDALDSLPSLDESQQELRNVVTGLEPPSETQPCSIDHWHNPRLNASQKQAVKQATGRGNCFLIHGPPGTGKTTTAIEVIQQYIAEGKSVLATAASNMAVDNMVEFLINQGVFAVRAGHPARVTPALQKHTLDSIVQDHEAYQKSQNLRENAFDIKDQQDDLTHPSGRWRRGMSNDRIKQLAKNNRSSRGVPQEKIDEMAEWLELQEKADELFERSDELEDQAIEEILEEADVVCTTNSTAGSELLEDNTFDVAVIDEATQATEPSCLIPLTKAHQAVMAGDHRQLPPTIKNMQAAEEGLQRTLFEKLTDWHGDTIKHMLNTQYRMHETIMNFSSDQFYDGELQADDSVRYHTLRDLDLDLDQAPSSHDDILNPDEPLTFVNTRHLDAAERSREGSTSRENPLEADLVSELARDLISANLSPEQIAVIAPYDDQVDLIESQLDEENLEIKTVDGFQGREKEVVIISMTRSNVPGNIGFLQDKRRFNVALTRAKRKAIVVGDEQTISTDRTYQDFINYVREQGHEIQPE